MFIVSGCFCDVYVILRPWMYVLCGYAPWATWAGLFVLPQFKMTFALFFLFHSFFFRSVSLSSSVHSFPALVPRLDGPAREGIPKPGGRRTRKSGIDWAAHGEKYREMWITFYVLSMYFVDVFFMYFLNLFSFYIIFLYYSFYILFIFFFVFFFLYSFLYSFFISFSLYSLSIVSLYSLFIILYIIFISSLYCLYLISILSVYYLCIIP